MGGTLIFSYICKLGHFWGSKFFNFNIFFVGGGGSEKLILFGGMKVLLIFLGVITKLDYI